MFPHSPEPTFGSERKQNQIKQRGKKKEQEHKRCLFFTAVALSQNSPVWLGVPFLRRRRRTFWDDDADDDAPMNNGKRAFVKYEKSTQNNNNTGKKGKHKEST